MTYAVWIKPNPSREPNSGVPMIAYSPEARIGAAPHGHGVIWFPVDEAGMPCSAEPIREPDHPACELIVFRLAQAYSALASLGQQESPWKA